MLDYVGKVTSVSHLLGQNQSRNTYKNDARGSKVAKKAMLNERTTGGEAFLPAKGMQNTQ